MKAYLRLHFRTGSGYIADGSNTHHRAKIVELIKEHFDVPFDVELYLVHSHWLNVNMEKHIIDKVLNFLSTLPLYEGYGIFAAYSMNEVADNNPSIQNFIRKQFEKQNQY